MKLKKFVSDAAGFQMVQSLLDPNKIYVGTIDGVGLIKYGPNGAKYSDLIVDQGRSKKNWP